MKKIIIVLVILVIAGALGANAYFASNWKKLPDPQPSVVDQGFLTVEPLTEPVTEEPKVVDEESDLAAKVKGAREVLPELAALKEREAREFFLEWKKPTIGYLFTGPAQFKQLEYWWLHRSKSPPVLAVERFRSGDKTIYIYTYESSKKVLVLTDKSAVSCSGNASHCLDHFRKTGVL